MCVQRVQTQFSSYVLLELYVFLALYSRLLADVAFLVSISQVCVLRTHDKRCTLKEGDVKLAKEALKRTIYSTNFFVCKQELWEN